MKSVLITGAAGFLGRECCELFLKNNYRVIKTDIHGDVDFIGDLSQKSFVERLPDVDIVINCAAVQYVTKNLPLFKRNSFFYKNNILAAENLSNKYANSSVHFIHIGTSMMYKQTGQELYSIDSAKSPSGVYSQSKLSAQMHIDKIKNLATVIPCIIGGKGREGLFVNFILTMKRFGVVIIPGKGMHKIHMVHVEDVASLLLQIAKNQLTGIFNAGGEGVLSINEWIDVISNELNLKNIKRIYLPLFPIKILSQLLGYRLLAREQLLMLKYPHVLNIKESLDSGWVPKYSNTKIVQDIAQYVSMRFDA